MDGNSTVDDTPIVLEASGVSTKASQNDDDLPGSATSVSSLTLQNQDQQQPQPHVQDQDDDQNNESVDSVLECPICLQSCVHPVELPCSHIFCFLCIKGIAAQGNNLCAICRQSIPNNVLTHPRLKDISQLYKDPKLCNSFQWFYESRGGGWWMYDERTRQELEKAYESKLPNCRVLIAGNLYEIDFGQMIQYRLNNPSLFRRIKRDYATVEKRGIAGIRLNNNRSNSQEAGGAAAVPPHPAGEPEVYDIDDTDDENCAHDEDEEDDDDMDLEEEEDIDDSEDDGRDESGDSEGEEEESRDGARAPTRRSDRSNSSSNNQTPPSTPSGQFNGPSSGRGSRCGGGVSRNLSTNSRNSSSASASSSAEPNVEVVVGSESGNVIVENHQPPSSASSVSSTAPPSSSVMYNIDEINVNAPLDNGSLSYIIIGPSSLIRLQYNNTINEMDEIL